MADIRLVVPINNDNDKDVRFEDIEELLRGDPESNATLDGDTYAIVMCANAGAARSVLNCLTAFGFSDITASSMGHDVMNDVRNAPPLIAKSVPGYDESDYNRLVCPRTRAYLNSLLTAIEVGDERKSNAITSIRESLDVFTELTNFDLLDTHDQTEYVSELVKAVKSRYDSQDNEVVRRLFMALDALDEFSKLRKTGETKLRDLHDGANKLWNTVFHSLVAAGHEADFAAETEDDEDDEL